MCSAESLATIQVEPAAQKQPALAAHQVPRRASFTEEFSPPYFVHRLAGMLQDVKLVVDDPALRHPLLQALPERFPHVHTRRSNRTSLKCTQVLLEKLIQRLLLPFPTKPQQRRAASALCPALQIPQIDRPHRTRCQAKLPRHS